MSGKAANSLGSIVIVFLFHSRHGLGHIHKGSADSILRQACRRLELEGVSTHSFRRTALTQISNSHFEEDGNKSSLYKQSN